MNETPEDVAARLWKVGSEMLLACGTVKECVAWGIRDDRKQIAAWCEECAQQSERQQRAAEQDLAQTGEQRYRDAAAVCEGRAQAYRAIAAMLGGGA